MVPLASQNEKSIEKSACRRCWIVHVEHANIAKRVARGVILRRAGIQVARCRRPHAVLLKEWRRRHGDFSMYDSSRDTGHIIVRDALKTVQIDIQGTRYAAERRGFVTAKCSLNETSVRTRAESGFARQQ